MTTSVLVAPATPVTAAVGLTWIPYLVIGVALIGVAVVGRFRARTRSSATLAEFLLIRGSMLVLIGVLVFLLSDAASEGDGVTAADRPIWSWLVDRRTAPLTVAAKAVTEIGSTVSMGALALIAVVGLAWNRRRGDAILIATVAAGAGLAVAISKPIIGRVRPPVEFRLVTETNQSFPSGHALASIAILGVLAVVFARRIDDLGRQAAVYAAVAVIVVFIGLSRLYLGVHWPTDVLGGWLTGFGWLLLCLTARHWWRTYPIVLNIGSRTLIHHQPLAAPDQQVPGADLPRRATT